MVSFKSKILAASVLFMSAITKAQPEAEQTGIVDITVAGIPVIVLAGLALVLIGLVTVVFLLKDKIRGSSDEAEQQMLREDAEQKLEEMVETVKQELEEGQSLESHQAREDIDKAEKAVEEGDFRKALDIMDHIEDQIK